MGRPVNDRWMGADASATKFLVLANVGDGIQECSITAQKGSRSFLCKGASKSAICKLVNWKENTSSLAVQAETGNAVKTLNVGEMIMNCKAGTGSTIHRVMKIMNRTLYYAKNADAEDATYTEGTWFQANWSFSNSDRAAAVTTAGATKLEVVQLENRSAAQGGEFHAE